VRSEISSHHLHSLTTMHGTILHCQQIVLWDHITSNCVAPWHELGNQRPNNVIRAQAPMPTTETAACTSSFSLELQRKRATSLLLTVKMQMNNQLRSGSRNSTMPSRRFKSKTPILLGNYAQESSNQWQKIKLLS
jgi:hypothetical protein